MKVRIIITALFIALLSTFFADKADASPWRDRRYYRYDRYGWRKEYRYEPRTTMRHNVDYAYERYYPRRYYRRYNNDRYYRDRDYRRHYYTDRYYDDRYWHDRYYHDRFDDDKYYFRGGGY